MTKFSLKHKIKHTTISNIDLDEARPQDIAPAWYSPRLTYPPPQSLSNPFKINYIPIPNPYPSQHLPIAQLSSLPAQYLRSHRMAVTFFDEQF